VEPKEKHDQFALIDSLNKLLLEALQKEQWVLQKQTRRYLRFITV
jgi:hypothetical protein